MSRKRNLALSKGNLESFTLPCAAGSGRAAIFDSFAFYFDSLELTKEGKRLPLEPTPGGLLALLLERPGRVLSHCQLCADLWPDEISGDFDRRLNSVINKLRLALGDDAKHPHYIQTLSRRGYRFIGEVRLSAPKPKLLDSHQPKLQAFG